MVSEGSICKSAWLKVEILPTLESPMMTYFLLRFRLQSWFFLVVWTCLLGLPSDLGVSGVPGSTCSNTRSNSVPFSFAPRVRSLNWRSWGLRRMVRFKESPRFVKVLLVNNLEAVSFSGPKCYYVSFPLYYYYYLVSERLCADFIEKEASMIVRKMLWK